MMLLHILFGASKILFQIIFCNSEQIKISVEKRIAKKKNANHLIYCRLNMCGIRTHPLVFFFRQGNIFLCADSVRNKKYGRIFNKLFPRFGVFVCVRVIISIESIKL